MPRSLKMTPTNTPTISPTTRDWINRRDQLIRLWRYAGSALIVLLVCLSLWLWVKVPYLIDPWTVSSLLEVESLPDSTLQMMAMLLPVVVLMLLSVVFIFIVLLFFALANERRLIQLISDNSLSNKQE